MRITLTHSVKTVVYHGLDREALVITPQITLNNGIQGQLKFPIWEAWLDEPETIKKQQDAAVRGAQQSWDSFCKNPEAFQR